MDSATFLLDGGYNFISGGFVQAATMTTTIPRSSTTRAAKSTQIPLPSSSLDAIVPVESASSSVSTSSLSSSTISKTSASATPAPTVSLLPPPSSETKTTPFSPVLITTTLNGILFGINATNGNVLWSLDEGWGSLVRTFNMPWMSQLNSNPSNNAFKSSANKEKTNDDSLLYIPEPTESGNLYVFSAGKPITKLSVPISSLVDMSPFRTEDGSIYLGSKKSSLIVIDPITGRVIQRLKSPFEDDFVSNEDETMCKKVDEQEDLDLAVNKRRDVLQTAASSHGVLIGRTGRLIPFIIRIILTQILLTRLLNSLYSEYRLKIYSSANTLLTNISYSIINLPGASTKPSATNNMPEISAASTGHLLLRWSPTSMASIHFQYPVISVHNIDSNNNGETFTVSKAWPRSSTNSGSPQTALEPRKAWIGSLDGSLYALSSENYIEPTKELISMLPENPPSQTKDVIILPPNREVANLASCRPGKPGFPLCLIGRHSVLDLGAWVGHPDIPSRPTLGDEGPIMDEALLLPGASYPTLPGRPASPWERLNQQPLTVTMLLASILFGSLGVVAIQNRIEIINVIRKLVGLQPLPNSSNRKKRKGKQKSSAQIGLPDENGLIRLHNLVVTPEILGYGSHGTIVYKGSFQNRSVAVKRLLVDFWDVASKEVDLLRDADHHPNVVRYFCQEVTERFYYIALELCPASLADVIEVMNSSSNGSSHGFSIGGVSSWSEKRGITENGEGEGEGEVKKEGEENKENIRDEKSLWNKREEAIAELGPIDARQVMQQVMAGLEWLHHLKIVHRDIKPHNILLTPSPASKNNSNNGNSNGNKSNGVNMANGKPHPRVMISDFGLCKKLDDNQSSFHHTVVGGVMNAAGTVGWRAPECLLVGQVSTDSVSSSDSLTNIANAPRSPSPATHNKPHLPPGLQLRITRAIDIFSAGCVFYYVLSGGSHPYGERYERELNILNNKPQLTIFDSFDSSDANAPDAAEARDLILSMLAPNPANRPTAHQTLHHPYFWPHSKRLNFLQDVSDRFEIESKDPPSPLLTKLEKGVRPHVIGWDWIKKLDRSLVENLGKYRRYESGSVRDLMRVIRNKKHHYQDLPDHVRTALGDLPDGFLEYFTNRFPKLVLHVWKVVRDTPVLRQDPMFKAYFGD